jgi:hypothetical protein
MIKPAKIYSGGFGAKAAHITLKVGGEPTLAYFGLIMPYLVQVPGRYKHFPLTNSID